MAISACGGPQEQPGGDAVRVRVMGTPRSGTNLAKYLIERYLKVPVVFDQGFWKHGIFPALMDGREMPYGELPIVVVSKDPVSQLLSWYRQARNDTLFKPSRNLAAFLSQPFEVRQDFTEPRKMEYRFRTPADYWNQFYFAMDALRRTGVPVYFMRYEELVSAPAYCLNSLSGFLDLAPFDSGVAVTIPEQKLSAGNDIDRDESPTIAQSRFNPARAELASALARMGWRNASTILRGIDDDVLRATGRAGFRKTCRDAAGARAMLRSLVGLW